MSLSNRGEVTHTLEVLGLDQSAFPLRVEYNAKGDILGVYAFSDFFTKYIPLQTGYLQMFEPTLMGVLKRKVMEDLGSKVGFESVLMNGSCR